MGPPVIALEKTSNRDPRYVLEMIERFDFFSAKKTADLDLCITKSVAHIATPPFTILDPQNPWIDEFYVFQERCATNFKESKL